MCRTPWCDRRPTSGRYCSEQCRVKYDHIKADAKDAMLADEERAREEADEPPEPWR